MMRVLLIFPPASKKFDPATLSPYPPLGLLYLASSLRQVKIDVKILDCVVEKLDFSSALKHVKEINPDIVGISILTSMRYSAFEIAKQIKKVIPKVMVIVGGSHATVLHRQILENIPEVDVVVRGEGEQTFKEVVLGHEKQNIKGISYRGQNGRVFINEEREEIKNLDNIGLPAYDLVPMQKYFNFAARFRITKRFPSAHILTSRGCVAKCIFCTTPKLWKRIRFHSPEYVIENIKFLNNNYGVQDIMIFDDTFPVSSQWLERFYELYKKNKLNISYRCFSRVTSINERSITRLRETGCYYILFGIESGSPKILSSLKKYITVDQIKEAVSYTRSNNISPGGFFMVGFPGETLNDIADTIKLAKELKLSEFHFAATQLLPGSEMAENAKINDSFWFAVSRNRDLTEFSFSPSFESSKLSAGQIEGFANYANYQVLKSSFLRCMIFKMKNQRISWVKSFIYSIRDLLSTAGKVQYREDSYLLKRFQWNFLDELMVLTYNILKRCESSARKVFRHAGY